jgi:hypothetical protein
VGAQGLMAVRCWAGQTTWAAAKSIVKARLGNRPPLVLVHAFAGITTDCAARAPTLRMASASRFGSGNVDFWPVKSHSCPTDANVMSNAPWVSSDTLSERRTRLNSSSETTTGATPA